VSPSEDFSGLGGSIDRLEKRTEEEKRRLEERKEILNLLRKANEEIQELKKSRVTRDEMTEFFDKFLNEFSHVIAGIEDTKTKGLMSRFMKTMSETVNALKEG
jgi:predicted RNA-binding protein with EMAP domain